LIAKRIFDVSLGELKEGAAADIVLHDYDPSTPLTDDNWIGQLIFGISQSPVDTTIVAGNILMQGQRLLLDLDEKEIHAKARKQAEELWKRM
jgi:cytosine/adenosine deaminase-related metal-dependent hydrolase